jgi:hypothetical protein
MNMVEDMMTEVVGRGVDEALDQRWSGETPMNSSTTGGACEVSVEKVTPRL